MGNCPPVVEHHVPEIGGTDVSSPTLANRYGRGYFISGVGTGNGTTFYNEDGIDSDLSTFNLLLQRHSFESWIGWNNTVTIPGTLSITGNVSGGTGQIDRRCCLNWHW
ncbi:hypothetical protein IPG36_06715 [bacterium]|nr:MAG: hypothetical protein IPG36_06715 [bacterium]